ncbi:MAG: GntR family transcriptional regulator [Clostridia bacterium]|nr:GntR family transcriptional regulator [Clostridia bacterium]
MSTSDSPVKTPLYLDLYRKLREKIESGEYAVGSKIPSEQEITEEYGVSRITSKHALEQLVSEGFIRRFPGKGTFVQSSTAVAAPAPSAATHAPVGEKSNLIGVVLESLSRDFGGEILMGIEQKCAELGYSALIKFSYGKEEREAECIRELLAAGVKGIVMMCVYNEVYSPTIMKLSLEGFPLIFLDHYLKGLPIPFVGTDHLQAARQLTGELIARGHTHLALAMFDESGITSSAADRVNGYMETCLKHNLSCRDARIVVARENIHHPSGEERAENIRIIHQFLQDNPETTAILAMSARVGTIVLEAVAGTNVKTVASFDGPQPVFQAPCDLIYVVQDQLLMGSTVCQQLISIINGQEVPHVTYLPHLLCSK